MSADAASGIGAATVSTIGTVAVAGMAIKAVGKVTGGMNRRSSGRRSTPKAKHYKSFSGKRSKSNSFSIWK